MTDALRPMTKQRLYEQVLERLRQYVVEGGLRMRRPAAARA